MLVRGSGTLLLSKPCPFDICFTRTFQCVRVVSSCMFVWHYAKLRQTRQHFPVTPSALTGGGQARFHAQTRVFKGGSSCRRWREAGGRGGWRADSCRAAAAQCVCNLPPRTMCSTLPMTKCQCKKPPAQSAPLCRGVPRSTLAVRLAALHRNNNLPIPELKSASSSFPFIYFSGSMLFTSVTPPPPGGLLCDVFTSHTSQREGMQAVA